MRYTIALNFPDGIVYPTLGEGFTYDEKSPLIRTWEDLEVAKTFAKEICGKYDYYIVEIPNDSAGN